MIIELKELKEELEYLYNRYNEIKLKDTELYEDYINELVQEIEEVQSKISYLEVKPKI